MTAQSLKLGQFMIGQVSNIVGGGWGGGGGGGGPGGSNYALFTPR